MKLTAKAFLTASALFFSMSLHAVEQASTLVDLYRLALERDAEIAAAEYARNAGREARPQSRSFLLPSLTAGGNYQYNYQEVNNGGFDSKDSYGVNLALRQALFHMDAIVAYKEADFLVDQADIQYELALQDLILRVAQAYFDILSAKESVGVAQAQKTAFAESLERAKLAFTVGTATITDKLEAQARYDLAVASEIAAQNALAVARQALGALINELPPELQPVGDAFQISKVTPDSMEVWVDAALEKNLQVKLSNLGVEIAKREVSRVRATRLPTVDLVGQLSESKTIFGTSELDTTSATVRIEAQMPLFTGGLTTSQVRQQVALREEQRERMESTRRQISLQAQQNFLAVQNGYQQVQALKQALASSQSALDATKKGLEVGVRTNLDLLDAQQQFFSTKRDYTVARYEYLMNILRLKAVAGELTETDVQAMTDLLRT